MKKYYLLIFCACLLLSSADAFAQRGGNGEGEAADTTDTFTELTEGTTHRPGYIDTYAKDGHLYLAIPKDMLGRGSLMNFEIAEGIGSSGLYGGTMLNYFRGPSRSLRKTRGQDFLYAEATPTQGRTRYSRGPCGATLAYSPSGARDR
ncbi:MAG: DUF5118 domain-containing protein [Balneolaceae bacterium]|nr:DUF5118 domain-containing protein [Balneolaceae bacterium]